MTDAPGVPIDSPAGREATRGPGPVRRRIAAGWASLGAPVVDRRVPGTMGVAVLAAVVGAVAGWLSVSSGAALFYDDASSHLTIARRLFDAVNPGFQQLGTVWLPIPHLLLAPLTIPLGMWRTGAAGAVLGTLCLVATTSALYRVAARLGMGRAARLIVVAALLANPSVLYIHTTALTEPVLIAGLSGGLAGLSRWATARRRVSGGELAVFAGIPTTVAVMSRYEGWVFLGAGAVLIVVVQWRRAGGVRGLWRPLTGFGAVPAVAMLWWFAYNWATYRDPLAFARGVYSAAALQRSTAEAGMSPTRGNLGLSLATYNWSLLYTAGFGMLILAAAGMCVLAYQDRFGVRTLVVGASLATYVFSVASLYLGQTIMWNTHTLPVDQWNTRFAMSVMIPVALAAGVAVDAGSGRSAAWAPVVGRLVLGLAVVLLVAQTVWWAQAPWQHSAVMAEARVQVHAKTSVRSGFLWLHSHYHGGGVLIDETSTGYGSMPTLGIPLRECLTRSSGPVFARAIASPERHVKWVMVQRAAFERGSASSTSAESDLVGSRLRSDPQFTVDYRLAYQDATNLVFERIGDGR
jgi:hypothetical protein